MDRNELNLASANQAQVRSPDGEHMQSRLQGRFDDALNLLSEAVSYAKQLQRNRWDFAVEIGELHRIGVTNNDLRWLVCEGLVEHGCEVTKVEDPQRVFGRTAELRFRRSTTCFVLSEKGIAALFNADCPLVPAEQSAGVPFANPTPSALLPQWDWDRRELRIGGHLVRCFKVPCPDQETILMAFEEEGWPPRVDNLLSWADDQVRKRRLQAAVHHLNRNQKECRIRFQLDGLGEGILWATVTAKEQNS